jgi:H+/Cl- antiporter ClcA
MNDMRNGLVTAMGVILGFALNFFAKWSTGPVPWKDVDRLPAWMFLLGLVFMFVGLFSLLLPGKQGNGDRRYRRAVWISISGAGLIFLALLTLSRYWRALF